MRWKRLAIGRSNPAPLEGIAELVVAKMRRRLTPNLTLEKDQATADAEGYGFGAGGGAKFSEDRGDVEFCGVIGNSKARGDLFVAEARGEHLQDFAFAAGERFGQFGKGLRSRCRGNGQGGLQIGRMEHDEADASGLQSRDKLIGSDIAGQNGADSGSQASVDQPAVGRSVRSTMEVSEARSESATSARMDSERSPEASISRTPISASGARSLSESMCAALPTTATPRAASRFCRPARASGDAATMKTRITRQRISAEAFRLPS